MNTYKAKILVDGEIVTKTFTAESAKDAGRQFRKMGHGVEQPALQTGGKKFKKKLFKRGSSK